MARCFSNHLILLKFQKHNACHNGLGKMAAFLRLFAKMVTACPSPLAGTCYVIVLLGSSPAALFVLTFSS